MERAEDFTCAQLVELVTDYFEGALTREQRAAFDEHLLQCEDCVSHLEQMRVTIALTGRLREDDLAPAMKDTLVRAFRGWRANSPG